MIRIVTIVGGAFLVAACADMPVSGTSIPGPTYESAKSSGLLAANFDAADQLLSMAQRPLGAQVPIIVTTLVNLDDLNQTSSLGRLISEHIATRVTQRGLNVAELRLTSKVYVRAATGGEMMLSRDIREIAANHNAQAVIVGTFSVGSEYVYVNVKLIEGGENRVIAAHSYLLPNVGQVKVLARGRIGPS